MKAKAASEAKRLEDIPNIGPATVRDFHTLGIREPSDLKGKDPLRLYQKMCKISGVRHDLCVLDTYMAAIDFMNGASPRPWWHYTKQRKSRYLDI